MNNEETFPQLVEAHYTALYRFALSLAKRPADASDLTQQTFFCWAKHGQALRDANKAKTWLFTTLHREFLRTHRRARRFTSIEELSPTDRDPPDRRTDFSQRMDAEFVVAALQHVDLIFREALTLFYLQDLSCLEIAEVLSIPLGTVTTRLFRGKKQLRLLLEHGVSEARPTAFSSLAACA